MAVQQREDAAREAREATRRDRDRVTADEVRGRLRVDVRANRTCLERDGDVRRLGEAEAQEHAPQARADLDRLRAVGLRRVRRVERLDRQQHRQLVNATEVADRGDERTRNMG